MIIGADPDEPQEFERSSKKKPALGKTNKLVNHFVSNRQAIMYCELRPEVIDNFAPHVQHPFELRHHRVHHHADGQQVLCH